MTSVSRSENRERLLNRGLDERTKVLVFLDCFIHHFLQVNFSAHRRYTERIVFALCLIGIAKILSGLLLLLFLTHFIYSVSTTVESLIISLSFFFNLPSKNRLITFSYELHLDLADQRVPFFG